jgi:hypothetical protein
MVKRWIAGLLGAMAIGNGLFMLIAGQQWYLTTPGASDTGPYNFHFVADIGVAFLVAGAGLAARAWRPRYWPAALTAAGFLFGHGLIHLVGLIGGHAQFPLLELGAIIGPAALTLWVALPEKGGAHA